MKVSRTIYWLFAWLFVVGVLTQVFFAGMTVVARQWPWTNHMSLGHLLAAPLLVMLATAWPCAAPARWATRSTACPAWQPAASARNPADR